MKMSIRNRIIFTFASLMVLVLLFQLVFNLFFSMSYYVAYKSSVMTEAYEAIRSAYDGTSASIESASNTYETGHNIDVIVTAGDEMIYVSYNRYLDERKGAIPEYFGNPPERMSQGSREEIEFSINPEPLIRQQSIGNSTHRMLELPGEFLYGEQTIRVLLSLPVASIEDSVDVFSSSSIAITGAVLILGLLFLVWMSNGITKPLREIEVAAYRFSTLDFSSRVDENIPSTELKRLSGSINSMAEQLEKSIGELSVANEKLQKDIDSQKKLEQMRREFVGSVSHEMKTPLALLQIYAANLKSNVDNIDKNFYCDTIIEETEKLSDMVSSMLDISSIKSGLVEMEKQVVPVSEICEELIEKMYPLLEGADLTYDIDPHIYVMGSPRYIEQAMRNYILNATEHIKSGGLIRIALKSQSSICEFSVYNEGSSISDNDIDHIWQSFYRSDKARERSGKNTGLGLHIVKTVVEEHGGSCSVQNKENGVTFTFTLPIIEE